MAYTIINFKTKKALKESVAKYQASKSDEVRLNGVLVVQPIRCYQPGLGPDLSNYTGKITLEGPHYPKPHTWYAEAWLVNGVVVKVK